MYIYRYLGRGCLWGDLSRNDAWGAAFGSVNNAWQPVSIASSLDLGVQVGASINVRWALCVGRDMSGIVFKRLPKAVNIIPFGTVHQHIRGFCAAIANHASSGSRISRVRRSEISLTYINLTKFIRSALRSVPLNASAPSLYRAQALAV